MAHAHDLRAEVAKKFETEQEADAYVRAIVADWRKAPLDAGDRALCVFAAKLTHDQRSVRPADLDELRGHGFDDTAIHDAVQVVAYFNYITRVADALGIETEPFTTKWEADSSN